MSKSKAFLTHLVISILIFITVLYFIVFHWYPQPFFATDGGWQGIRIIATVDLILGPLLTLIVFKPGKPRLKLDLTLIGIIQLSALISGIWIVYNERPVAKVFVDGVFYPVSAHEYAENFIPLKNLEQYRINSTITIYSDLPASLDEMMEIRRQALRTGTTIAINASLYKTFTPEIRRNVKQYSVNMRKYLADDKQKLDEFNNFLALHNAKESDFYYFPLKSRYEHVMAVVKPETMDFVDVLHDIPAPKIEDHDDLIEFELSRKSSLKKQKKADAFMKETTP